MRLERYVGNPILQPQPKHLWESKAVFNCATVYNGGKVHMLYRAIGEYDNYISRIGYAVSRDGVNFVRNKEPIFTPKVEFDKGACEDPRITKIDNKFYVTYVALCKPPFEGGKYVPNSTRIALASTNNFREFKRHGDITPKGAKERDAVFFPEKIKGRYVMLHRPRNWIGDKYGTKKPSIWIAYSNDLIHWYGHKIVMKPHEWWEFKQIGAGAPPIKTERGWLEFYHGVDKNHVYRLGVALFDLADPSILLARQGDPILEPEKCYEVHGDASNIVFTCGAIRLGNQYYVYYGGADKVIGVATVNVDKATDFY